MDARARNFHGFTLIETLTVVLILGILGTLALTTVGNIDASERARRAGREAITALRYARMMSLSSGNTYGVAFDTTNKLIWVYKNTSATVASNNMGSGNTYQIDLTKEPDIRGATVAATLAAQTGSPAPPSTPWLCAYRALGATSNTGTITFTYAGHTQTILIPSVGDPIMTNTGSSDSW